MSDINKIKNYHAKLDLNRIARERVRSSEDDHHMEFVEEICGTAFINDSRSITIAATNNSLAAIETSVVLIIGGDDRDNDYSVLAGQIEQKVIAVIYLGNDSNKILKHFSQHQMLFVKANHIAEAVQTASAYSRSGDVVLFSPACPSYHAHDNYKNRGNEFKDIVKKMNG